VAGVAAAAVLAGAAAAWVWSGQRAARPGFQAVALDRGTIVATVSTTGTLNAVTTVQVGSQVSGQIKELHADFNSRVRRGQLIARLDPQILQAKLDAARAELDQAQAAVLNQRANVEKARAEVENVRASGVAAAANVDRMRAEVENARAAAASARAAIARETATVANARRELDRRIDLLRRELIAHSEKDQAQTTFDTATAQLDAAEAQERAAQAQLRSALAQQAAAESQTHAASAQLASARAALQVAEAQLQAAAATVRQRQAAVDQARVDLEHTEIRAPVNGVVVSRSVDVGQTVAASLQAPTLFTIAEDLTRMQVEAAVDEADIGRVREGLAAGFTVDAFPGRSFLGEIVQIRKAPQVVQNVVTYTVVIAVGNPDGSLMPGMTANVRVQVDRREDALRVPNAALRFRPPGDAGREPAQGAGPPPAGPRETAAGTVRPAEGPAPRDPAQLRERLTRELDLSPAQQARLEAALAETGRAFAALRGQALDEAGREAARRRIREDSRGRIRALLTPEQATRYDALVEARGRDGAGAAPGGMPGRVFVTGPDGTPRAVPIVVGITDGAMSEVVRGDLQAGQQVLVGQETVPGGATRPSGPRLRL
jgi:HlyD family secretion protein